LIISFPTCGFRTYNFPKFDQSPVKHVCVLGCGRSGTSILGELFQSIPNYRYYPEPEWSEFKSIDFSTPVAVKVPRTAPGVDPTIGLPFNMDELYRYFPRSGILFWQLRHPLDTVCSLQVGISKNWGHQPRPHEYKDWLNRSLIEQCAYHWNYINTRGFQQVKKMAVVNRFEDMILNPCKTALSCLKLAEIPIEKQVLAQVNAWSGRVQDEDNEKFQEADCSRPYSRNDHKHKVGRWKENLSAEEIAIVVPIVSEGAKLFDYELPD
jgi:hypothetical protein